MTPNTPIVPKNRNLVLCFRIATMHSVFYATALYLPVPDFEKMGSDPATAYASKCKQSDACGSLLKNPARRAPAHPVRTSRDCVPRSDAAAPESHADARIAFSAPSGSCAFSALTMRACCLDEQIERRYVRQAMNDVFPASLARHPGLPEALVRAATHLRNGALAAIDEYAQLD